MAHLTSVRPPAHRARPPPSPACRRPAGGNVRRMHRLRPAAPPASITARVAITVSPAPETSKTSRATACSCSAPPAWKERHSLFTARHQQAVQPEIARAAPPPCAPVRPRRASGRPLAQLGAVGRHHGRAGILREIVALGIDQHLLAGRAPGGSSRRCASGRPCRSRRGSPRHSRQDARRTRPAWRAGPRATATSRSRCAALLLAANHAQLDRGADRRIDMQADIDAARSPASAAGSARPRRRRRPTAATRAPSAATLRATLAAPPGRSSLRPTLTTGTGASGEMRATSPNQ
jgi:hypothetical protein